MSFIDFRDKYDLRSSLGGGRRQITFSSLCDQDIFTDTICVMFMLDHKVLKSLYKVYA